MKSRLFCLCAGFLLLAGLGCSSDDKPKMEKPDPNFKPTKMGKPGAPLPPPTKPE